MAKILEFLGVSKVLKGVRTQLMTWGRIHDLREKNRKRTTPTALCNYVNI